MPHVWVVRSKRSRFPALIVDWIALGVRVGDWVLDY